MATESDSRIDTFWRWLEHNAGALRAAILSASERRDVETLDAAATAMYEQLAEVSEELVVDIHAGTGEVVLAIRTGLADQSLVHRILAGAPSLPGWRFVNEVPRDLESVVARDDSGREIVVPYAALTFAMTETEHPGKYTILIVFDGDFELGGTDQRLFHDVATHVLTTFLGRIPNAIATYALVPARMASGMKTSSIFELPSAWAAATREPRDS